MWLEQEEEYWKYESALKNGMQVIFSRWSSRRIIQLGPTLQARRKDTILDDFIISLRVAQEGYTIQYDLKRMP
jgi:hypothetical protein